VIVLVDEHKRTSTIAGRGEVEELIHTPPRVSSSPGNCTSFSRYFQRKLRLLFVELFLTTMYFLIFVD